MARLYYNIFSEEEMKCGRMLSYDVRAKLREYTHDLNYCAILIFYLLYKVRNAGKNPLLEYEELLNGTMEIKEEIKGAIKEKISIKAWDAFKLLADKYSEKEFAAAALCIDPSRDTGIYTESRITPESLNKLAIRVLDIKEGENCADICSGYGSFLNMAYCDNSDVMYYGYEINTDANVIAMIISEFIEADIQYELTDVFSLYGREDLKYDKIFSNYPFGLRLRRTGYGNGLMEKITSEYSGISTATSSDWIFNVLISKLLKKTGKAVAIMTNGSTWNTSDLAMRRYFIEQGLIEAVITLPAKLFSYTTISTTMIIFSHNNETVRLVDATKLCQNGRRYNTFSDENIEEIIAALNNDCEMSKKITVQELRQNEYTLNLQRYAIQVQTYENAVPLESVLKSITRGAPCSAAQLDEMSSEMVTNMQYLMLANIKDGLIDNKLPYLSNIDKKYEKYCLKNNNLLLSKNGYPYKVAVASVRDGQKILANGNMYIMELDEEKINPYFLKAFFESDEGMAALKSITVGATIPNIGVEKLRKINIPLPSLEEQNKLVEEYRATLDEIAVLKLKTERAIDRLHHIFDKKRGDRGAEYCCLQMN